MTLEDLEALLEDIDFMTTIYGLFDFEESGTLTISGWSKNLRTNLGYDTYIQSGLSMTFLVQIHILGWIRIDIHSFFGYIHLGEIFDISDPKRH